MAKALIFALCLGLTWFNVVPFSSCGLRFLRIARNVARALSEQCPMFCVRACVGKYVLAVSLFNLGPPARLATCAERGRGPLRTSHSPPPTPYNREPPNVKIPVLSLLHTYPSK